MRTKWTLWTKGVELVKLSKTNATYCLMSSKCSLWQAIHHNFTPLYKFQEKWQLQTGITLTWLAIEFNQLFTFYTVCVNQDPSWPAGMSLIKVLHYNRPYSYSHHPSTLWSCKVHVEIVSNWARIRLSMTFLRQIWLKHPVVWIQVISDFHWALLVLLNWSTLCEPWAMRSQYVLPITPHWLVYPGWLIELLWGSTILSSKAFSNNLHTISNQQLCTIVPLELHKLKCLQRRGVHYHWTSVYSNVFFSCLYLDSY